MRERLRAVTAIVLTIVVLVALYWVLQDQLGSQPQSVPTSATFELTIAAPRPDEPAGIRRGSPVFKARRGQQITLKISSELPGSAHIHGYELQIVLIPNGVVELTFACNIAGVFPVHLHDSEGTMEHVALLEVHAN